MLGILTAMIAAPAVLLYKKKKDEAAATDPGGDSFLEDAGEAATWSTRGVVVGVGITLAGVLAYKHRHGIVRAVKAVAAPQALPAGQSDWYDEDDLDSYVEWEA